MRSHYVLATISLAAALTACSKQQDATTAAQAKTPQASTASADLVAAPRPYERMRFVSEIEQSKSNVQMHSPEHARHASRSTVNRNAALSATREAIGSKLTSVSVPMSVASSSAPSPSIAVATTQAAPPMTMPAAAASEVVGDHQHGLGGLVGSVMIRGGVGPNGKCDPRSDAQAAGMLAGRPNSAMPLMPSSSVFGRR